MIALVEMIFYKKKSKIAKTAKICRFCRIINSEIGRYSYVGPNSVIRNSSVGSFCSIAENVKVGYGLHRLDRISNSPLFYAKKNIFGKCFSIDQEFVEFVPTVIGNDVMIGTNVFINDGIRIGSGAIIGAGSIVTRDIKPYEVVAGNPARTLRYRFDEVTISKLLSLQWWNWSEEKLQGNEIFRANLAEIKETL